MKEIVAEKEAQMETGAYHLGQVFGLEEKERKGIEVVEKEEVGKEEQKETEGNCCL